MASSFGQAKITFGHVRAFMAERIAAEPRRWRIQDSQNIAQIADAQTGIVLKCIGSDPRRAHGLAPSLTLCDEPAQWPPTTADAMIAALRTASGKIAGARIVLLGTRAAMPDHFFERALQGGADFALNYAAARDDDPFAVATWRRANPGLSSNPTLGRAIRRAAAKARRDPELLASFRALRLNLGVPDTVASVLIDADTWRRCESSAAAAGPYVLGIDLGATAAMSAFAAYWPQTGRLACFAVFPASPSLEERGTQDGVGSLYRKMHDQRDLLIAGKFTSDVKQALEIALSFWGRPVALAADRWREGDLREALSAVGFPQTDLELRGMGFRDGAEDVRLFRAACADGDVHSDRSLLLRSALSEARTQVDAAGNAKLSKSTQGGRRLRARDDAAAAAILAVASGSRLKATLTRPRRRMRHALGR